MYNLAKIGLYRWIWRKYVDGVVDRVRVFPDDVGVNEGM